MLKTWKSLEQPLKATARSAARPRRAIGLMAVIAMMAGSFSLAAAPASARVRDSVWLTIAAASGMNAQLTATTNVNPRSTFITLVDRADGSTLNTCVEVTSCSALVPIASSSSYVAYVYAYSTSGGWSQTLISTSNIVGLA